MSAPKFVAGLLDALPECLPFFGAQVGWSQSREPEKPPPAFRCVECGFRWRWAYNEAGALTRVPADPLRDSDTIRVCMTCSRSNIDGTPRLERKDKSHTPAAGKSKPARGYDAQENAWNYPHKETVP